MHEILDHDNPKQTRISFKAVGKTQCSSDVAKPIIAKGTKQYPRVLIINRRDLHM